MELNIGLNIGPTSKFRTDEGDRVDKRTLEHTNIPTWTAMTMLSGGNIMVAILDPPSRVEAQWLMGSRPAGMKREKVILFGVGAGKPTGPNSKFIHTACAT